MACTPRIGPSPRPWAKGDDVVVRLNGPRSPVSFAGFRTDNRRVVWLKPARPEWMRRREYQHIPSRLVLRAVRVRITRVGFRTRRVVLITTLTDAEAINGASLADLYRRRWQAELHLRSLKQTLQMDILRGHSPEIVDKEVWAHLLVYNLVRTVMAKAAASESLRPDQISFAGALQSINGFLPHMREAHTAEDSQVLWEVLLWAVAELIGVGNRPDRYEPRAVKRHPKSLSTPNGLPRPGTPIHVPKDKIICDKTLGTMSVPFTCSPHFFREHQVWEICKLFLLWQRASGDIQGKIGVKTGLLADLLQKCLQSGSIIGGDGFQIAESGGARWRRYIAGDTDALGDILLL